MAQTWDRVAESCLDSETTHILVNGDRSRDNDTSFFSTDGDAADSGATHLDFGNRG
jgi:hypothetical protein